MERTYKTWGEKWNLFKNDLCEVSILYLRPERRCSWHFHKAKFNLFFVIQGRIWVKTDSGEITIGEKEIFTTRPEEYHEFSTGMGDAIVMEVMYVQYDSEDIVRKTLGGPTKELKDDFVEE